MGPLMQPEGELNESKSKKMKGNENNFVFICFHFLFGIWTFQRVTGEKNKKIPIPSDSRGGLWD